MKKSSIFFAGFSQGQAFAVRRFLYCCSHNDSFINSYSVLPDYQEPDVPVTLSTTVIINCERYCRRAAALYFMLRSIGCYVIFYSTIPINSHPLIDFYRDSNVSFLIAPETESTMELFAEKFAKRERFLTIRAQKIFTCKNFHTIADLSRLSYTEQCYLYYLIAGKTEQNMRDLMHCGKSSIDSYRTRVFEKLGIDSKNELHDLLII